MLSPVCRTPSLERIQDPCQSVCSSSTQKTTHFFSANGHNSRQKKHVYCPYAFKRHVQSSNLQANVFNFQTNYAILFVASWMKIFIAELTPSTSCHPKVELVLSILTQPSALMCIVVTVATSEMDFVNDFESYKFVYICIIFISLLVHLSWDPLYYLWPLLDEMGMLSSVKWCEVITWVLFLKKNEDPDWAPKIGGVRTSAWINTSLELMLPCY